MAGAVRSRRGSYWPDRLFDVCLSDLKIAPSNRVGAPTATAWCELAVAFMSASLGTKIFVQECEG
jgi:hypothetical protein